MSGSPKCLNHGDTSVHSSDYNFPVGSNDFYRYQQRSCWRYETDSTSGVTTKNIIPVENCGSKNEISRYDQTLCAAWLQWGSWSSCSLYSTEVITDEAELANDPDLSYDVWKRAKVRTCNMGNEVCMNSPTLLRQNVIRENCGK